jgi:HK97 family phage portal protein
MPVQVWTAPPLPAPRRVDNIAVRGTAENGPVVGRRWDGNPEKLPLELAASINVWAYRARRAIMAAFNSAPPICRDKRTNEIIGLGKKKSPLARAAQEYLDFLARPNSEMSGNDLFDAIVDWMNVRQAFLWMVPASDSSEDTKKRPDVLHLLPAGRVYPKKDGVRLVGWEVRYGDGKVKETIPAWQVIRIGFHNTLDPLRGLPPMSVGFTAADLGYAIDLHHVGYFDRGMKLDGILAPKEAVGPDVQARIQAAADAMAGTPNNHGVMVLPGDVTFTSMQAQIKDADFQALDNIVRDKMAAAYGVPRFLMGVPGDNRGDEKEALRTFHSVTVGPIRDDVRDKLNRHLSWRFHPDLLLDFDLSQVTALAEDRNERAKAFDSTASALKTLVSGGIITTPEAREMLNEDFGLELDPKAKIEESTDGQEPPQAPPPAPAQPEPEEEEE